MNPEPLIGARVPRVEDERLLRGEGRYVGDLRPEGLLHAAFVRCLHGRARITRMSLESSRTMPGVAGVFTAADLPALRRTLPLLFPSAGLEARMPSPLVVNEVRFAGEAVAVVVADDPYRAADGARAVEVEYGELPVTLDPLKALEPGAALVHTDVPSNFAGSLVHAYGDVDQAFQDAPVIVHKGFRVERAAGAAMEPRAVMAEPDMSGRAEITIYDSTQAPHAIRRGIAEALGLPLEQVRVVAPDVGGGFGPKGRLYPEAVVVAALARHLGHPIMWEATRTEDMLTTYQGRGAVIEAELAADADGTLRGLRAGLIQDCGAYLATGLTVPQNTAQHMLGPYRLPAAQIEISAVYTHKTPLTPLRGGGREVGVFVMERLMDLLARRLDLDPLVVRERNALQPGDFPFDTGYPSRSGDTVVYDSGDYPGCLQRASELIDYQAIRHQQRTQQEPGHYRGVAVTLFVEATGMASESARAELLPDGRVNLTVGSPSTGQSHATTMSQLCAERLGIPLDRILYRSGDTGAMDQGIGTFGSRMAIMAGNASAQAGADLRKRVLEAASDEIEAAPEDLEIVDGTVRVRGVPDRGISLEDLYGRRTRDGGDGEFSASVTFAPERPTAFAGGAHAAVVDVDAETGLVTIERYVVVHDCGTVVNPTVVEGQIIGGVAHGVGNVLGERMICNPDSGELQTASFQTYVVPNAEMIPRVEIVHHESPSPYNPEGIKGAGEGGTIGALATIAGAVEDAHSPFGIEINGLPILQQDMVRSLNVNSDAAIEKSETGTADREP